MFTCQLWELQSCPLLWICLQQLLVAWSSGCANHWCWRWCLQPWVRSRQDCCLEHFSLQAATSHPRNRSRDFNRGLQTISLRKIILAYLNVPTVRYIKLVDTWMLYWSVTPQSSFKDDLFSSRDMSSARESMTTTPSSYDCCVFLNFLKITFCLHCLLLETD